MSKQMKLVFHMLSKNTQTLSLWFKGKPSRSRPLWCFHFVEDRCWKKRVHFYRKQLVVTTSYQTPKKSTRTSTYHPWAILKNSFSFRSTKKWRKLKWLNWGLCAKSEIAQTSGTSDNHSLFVIVRLWELRNTQSNQIRKLDRAQMSNLQFIGILQAKKQGLKWARPPAGGSWPAEGRWDRSVETPAC